MSSTRSRRHSHLSSDFVWDSFHNSATRQSIPPADQVDTQVSLEHNTDDVRKSKSRSSKKAHIPSNSLVIDEETSSDHKDEPSAIATPAAVATADPSLQLRLHELEVQKLQLQLELARLHQHNSHQQSSGQAIASRRDDSTKSLGDMKAPERTLFPQDWPHIFAPGEPKLYSNLSLAEFCAGYLTIVENRATDQQKAAMMAHLLDLMVLASSYNWSAVRAFHYKVLRAIEMGLARWGQSFECFKQPFFLPGPGTMIAAPVTAPNCMFVWFAKRAITRPSIVPSANMTSPNAVTIQLHAIDNHPPSESALHLPTIRRLAIYQPLLRPPELAPHHLLFFL